MEGVPEDMWSPFKQLNSTLKAVLNDPNISDTTNFDLCLKKRKTNFANFLRNPPKNEKNRAQLLKSYEEGAVVGGRKMVVSKDLIDEAIILSDMYDLDEFHALEMLCTAQRQMLHHAGLPRGLVAILLYYDGRKALSCTLRDLFEVSAGVSWAAELPKELTTSISIFTQNLVEESNILGRLIELLESQLNLDKECELLTKNRAFGPKKHQNQVRNLFEDIRLAIATALFNWSAQRGLPKAIALRLFQYLIRYKTSLSNERIDKVGITLLMAMVYSFDTSSLQRQEDSNLYVKRLPILSEADFANEIYEKLTTNLNATINRYECFVKFCFGLSLASLRHVPSNLQVAVAAIIDRDELLVDDAISSGIFDFIHNDLLENELIFIHEFFYRRMHMVFTDFIDYMHSKVNELRGRADDTLRTADTFRKEGLEPPTNLDTSYELLMLCIGKLYKGNRCNLSLCDEYWCSLEANIPTNISYSTTTTRSVSLFKFIRMAGMLLTQTLFISYMRMLVGLTSSETSARNAFNLLKQAQSTPSTLIVSWDHFFSTMRIYYTNLRQDNVNFNTNDAIFRSRSMHRAICPREIAGLHATLLLIGNVATHDEISRIVFSQNENWSAIQLLMGLLSCSVPISLKAEILFTLSSLAKSIESAVLVWTCLEDSQIIKTVHSMTYNLHVGNLGDEIEQNECRNEEYPLSRGILSLLYTLVTTHMPTNLGIGSRKPGIDSYLNFVVNSIFLKFYTRVYKEETEKWQVGAECLKLLHHLVESYNPQPQDFLDNRESNSHPGFFLMLELNIKSDMLRLILILIEDVCRILDDYSSFPGKENVENCGLYSLLMLEQALIKQNVFFEAHSLSNSSVLLIGLNRMLLDLNPRTRQPDYLLNVMKFVTYNNWLPRHALASIKILHTVTCLPKVSEQILNICAGQATEILKLEIRQGFVECLDAIITKSSDSEESINSTLVSENAKIIEPNIPIELQIKEAILKLILRCIMQPMPNFGYFLLGYELHREVSSAVYGGSHYHSSIVIENGINCMMSLVVKMEKFLSAQKHKIASTDDNDYIAERCWFLIYNLCVNPRTSETTLRYFRNSCNDFLIRHLAALPYKHQTCSTHILNQMGHVLKCVTIELKLAATNNQISRFNKISEILIGSIESSSSQGSHVPLEYTNYLLQTTSSLHTTQSLLLDHNESVSNMHICLLLNYITLEEKDTYLPKFDYFEESQLYEIFKNCEMKNQETNCALINIKRLSGILHDELSTVQNSIASGQRQYILHEIKTVLMSAVQLNSERSRRSATVKLMEAWSQLTQILFTCVPDSAMPLRFRKQYIIDILEKLLIKLVPMQIRHEIAILGTETIMLLIAHLRYCSHKLENNLENENDTMPSDVDLSTELGPNKGKSPTRSNKSTTIHLRFILKNVLDWIMVSDVSSQKLRINLYTAFLYCLRIVKPYRKSDDDGDDYDNRTFSLLDRSKVEYENTHFNDTNQTAMVVEVLNSFGDKLIDTLCHDVINGHDICRMLAFSCLDLILEINPMPNVVNFISTRGYLGHIIESLKNSNAALSDTLAEVPENLKPLYVYESKMAFLLRYASSHIGAETLLAEKFLIVLSDMTVFDMHPDLKMSVMKPEVRHNNNNFIPDVDERYRSILFPALNTLDCIITTLGSQNMSACAQILSFLFSHSDMVESLLRTATPYMNLGILKELSSITNIIGRTASRDIGQPETKLLENYAIEDVDDDNRNGDQMGRNTNGHRYNDPVRVDPGTPNFDRDAENRLGRVQHLMLSLFGRFIINESTFENMLNPEKVIYDLNEENKNLHVKYFLEIATNISLYCRNVITCRRKSGVTSKFTITSLFNYDIQLLNGITCESKKLTAVTNVILNQLKGSVDFYLKQKSVLDNLFQQRSSLSNSFDVQAKIRHQELTKRYDDKQKILELVVFVTEQSMFLLWLYLDFHLRRPVNPHLENINVFEERNYGGIGGDSNNQTSSFSMSISREEIYALKQILLSTFNETFCVQLLATSESIKVGKTFCEALLRRIKTLIQFATVPRS